MNNNNINKLTDNLSDSEKKSLLNQITENLISNPIQVDEKYSNFIEKENKDFKTKSLKKDIDNLGFIQRLILNIRGFIMGKNIMEVYNHDLLQNLERRIVYTAPSLVSLKKRRFTSLIISDFSKIYSLSLPFISHFTEVWESPMSLQRLIGAIIAEKYNSVKNDLYDFLRESEIDKGISNGDDLELLKKKLLKSMYDYRKKMPEFIFPESEEELMSLISLKNIVLYNYAPLFKLMGISPGEIPNVISNKTVSMSLVVKHLEDFYKLLIHFSGTTLQQSSISALINVSQIENESEEELLWKNYNDLSDKLKKLMVAYPFDDLIKYSRNNPFYKVDFSISNINISEFYFSALKKEMIAELSIVYDLREKAVIELLFEKMFKNFDVVSLHNYTILKEFDYVKFNLKYFKYIDVLFILLNFLKHYYLRDYKDILFILSKHIYEKNHMLQTRALEISIGLETLLERILRFDRSLAAENEAGKTMRTLFTTVSTSRQNIRMYKAFIKQKDDEALELLKLGSKLLVDLDKILNQTLKSPSDSVKLQVSAMHPTISRKHTFKDVIIEKSKELKKFLDIYNKKIISDSEEK